MQLLGEGQYQLARLDNGARAVYALRPEAHSVGVFLFVGVGSRYESPGEEGLTHFIEHLLFKGTTRYPTPYDLAEAVDRAGGSMHAFTAKEFTGLWVHCDKTQWPLALEVVGEMAGAPLFDAAELEVEKDVIFEELQSGYATPFLLCRYLWDDLLYGGSRLAHPILGTPDALEGFTRDQVGRFYERFYHGGNVAVGLCGAFPEEAREQFARELARLPAGDQAEVTAVAYGQERVSCMSQDHPQAQVAVGVPSLALDDSDRYALTVLDSVLSGGMSGRVFTEVRERHGLAYAVDTVRQDFLGLGGYYVQMGVAAEKVEEAVKRVLDELRRLVGEPVGARELEKARNCARGRVALAVEEPLYPRFAVFDALLEGQVRTPDHILSCLDAVTAADVQRVAARLFAAEDWRLAVVGPEDDPARLQRCLTA